LKNVTGGRIVEISSIVAIVAISAQQQSLMWLDFETDLISTVITYRLQLPTFADPWCFCYTPVIPSNTVESFLRKYRSFVVISGPGSHAVLKVLKNC